MELGGEEAKEISFLIEATQSLTNEDQLEENKLVD
jgi:hypothetical protein